MKKHLIAAAVAAAIAVPAAAQVRISGTLDVQAYNSLERRTVGGATVKNIGSSATGIGASGGSSLDNSNAADGYSTSAMTFAATEDLGGGLKASAVWVQRMSNSTFGERERYIDLSGGFGAVRFGRFNPSITSNYGGISGLPTTGNAGSFYAFVSSGGTTDLSGSNVAYASGSFERQDNLMQYTSPNLSGFRIAVGYANSSTDTTATAGKAKTTQTYGTVAYANGPLELGLGFGKRELDTEATTPVFNDSDLNWLGAAYNLGMAKVHVTHGTRDQHISGTGKVHDADLTTLAVSVPMGATTLRAAFYEGKDSAIAANRVKLDGYQLAATYALSKRTFAYVVTGVNDKKRDGTSTATEVETKQTGIGISHSF